jgi:hypothetical protein
VSGSLVDDVRDLGLVDVEFLMISGGISAASGTVRTDRCSA